MADIAMSSVELAGRLEALLPPLDELGRRLSLAIHRALALGAPVRLSALSRQLGIEPEEAARRVHAWPGVYWDAERRIIGYWGLTLARTRHALRIDGRSLFAWCAWDTLFLPELLGARAEVSSACRATDIAVRLTVGGGAVEAADPPGLWVSFLVPKEEAVRADVVTAFCHYVHFFSSERTAAPWLEQHPDAFLVPLSAAFEVGRLRNRLRYGTALDAAEALKRPTSSPCR